MRTILHVVAVRWWSAIAWYAVSLAGAQRQRGCQVTLAVLEGSPAEQEAHARGLETSVRLGRSAASLVRARGEIAGEISSRNVDVLHVHTGHGHLPAELARWGRGTALVRTRGEARRPARAAHWLDRRADALTASATFIAAWMKPIAGRQTPVDVVLGGIDIERFSPGALPERQAARDRLGIEAKAPLAGIIGRLSPVKGHGVVLDAMRRLDERGTGVDLVVSGEEAQITRDDLRSRARTLGIAARIHFMDRVDDVRDLFGALDVGIVASTGSEAICRVAAEMMASGLPVVASNVSVLPDMIEDGVTGRLVVPGDADALAAAVGTLVEDAERRRAMGASARRAAVDRLSLEATARAFDAVYQRAIATRGAA